MQKELAEILVDALNEDTHEAEIREDYRGRGMSGPTTGVVFDGNLTDVLGTVIRKTYHFTNDDGTATFEDATFETDSMGMGTIIY